MFLKFKIYERIIHFLWRFYFIYCFNRMYDIRQMLFWKLTLKCEVSSLFLSALFCPNENSKSIFRTVEGRCRFRETYDIIETLSKYYIHQTKNIKESNGLVYILSPWGLD